MLKVAQHAAQLENYDRAIQIYEQVSLKHCSTLVKWYSYCFTLKVAASTLDSSLLKCTAKDYFFRAALCHLCVDLLNAQHAVERYQEQYPAFGESREAKLIKV